MEKKALILLSFLCFLTALPIVAAEDTYWHASEIRFHLIDNSSYVFLAEDAYASSVKVSGYYVNFSSLRLTSQSFSASFGVGSNGNVTIEEITDSYVKLTVSLDAGSWSYTRFYYTGTYPSAVKFVKGTYQKQIDSTKYYSDRSNFEADPSEAVYHNKALHYIEAKVLHESTVDLYVYTTSTAPSEEVAEEISQGSGGGRFEISQESEQRIPSLEEIKNATIEKMEKAGELLYNYGGLLFILAVVGLVVRLRS